MSHNLDTRVRLRPGAALAISPLTPFLPTGTVSMINFDVAKSLVTFDAPAGYPPITCSVKDEDLLPETPEQRPPTPGTEPTEWTQERLDALCREWQGVLRLQDWDVRAAIVRARDMELERVGGECIWVLEKREAAVHLLDPVDWHPDDPPQDIEKDLVHELQHLHFAPFMSRDKDSLTAKTQEQAIESIAKALMTLKRAGGASTHE